MSGVEITQTFGQEWCITYDDPVDHELIWMPFYDAGTWMILCEKQEVTHYDDNGSFTGVTYIRYKPINKYELKTADMGE